MNKLEHKKHYRKPIFIITVIGVILAAGIFSVFSYINTTNAKNVTDRTIEYIRSQCIRYEEITASDLAKSLFRIIDKTQEISRDIANFNDCSIERLKEFVADLSITGVIVLDENGTPENEYYTDDTGYNVWQDYIKQKKLTSVAIDTSKTYSDRLFSLPYDADIESDYCYDFAAVTRKDKKGIIFAYLKQSKETINNGQLTLDSLFSGFNLAMNGHIILTDGSKVIATNNNLYKGKTVSECPVINSFAGKSTNDADFVRITDPYGAYYGGMDKCRSYYVYVYYPAKEVYIGSWTATSIFTSLYIIFFLAASLIYRVISIRHLRESHITEEKYNEKLLKSAEEARRANAAKSDFLRRMSHDIRTPINVIMGMTEIADKNADDAERQAECRENIRTASGYLLELVNDVLDMGKLESGETYLEHVPFDLYEMFDEIAVLNGQNLQRKNITLTFEHCENLHNKLIGSPLHVKRILMNIIGNAIKYGKNGGYVKVSVSESEFDEKVPDTVVINITCKDNGIGMGENFMKVMFEPFMQENDQARTFYQGTGLGLAIAKRLTENMNGKIDCVSRKNIGTCFTVSLPFETDNSCECTDRSKVTVGEISLEGLTILLAEDNRLNMEITEFLLTNEGATVIKAWNGKEAIEIFELSEEYSIDAVLMDIMMPGTDGITAAKAIRSMERADVATVPIIALTANAFTDDKEKSRSAGMNEHLTKPVDSSKLKSVISGYTGKKDLTLRECYLLAGESYDDLLSRLGCDEKIIYNAVKEFMLDLHYIRLLRAIENRGTETAFKASHTMKGISANLGFTKMYSAFSLVTEELRSGNIEKAAELMTRATDEYQKIIAAFKRCMFDK